MPFEAPPAIATGRRGPVALGLHSGVVATYAPALLHFDDQPDFSLFEVQPSLCNGTDCLLSLDDALKRCCISITSRAALLTARFVVEMQHRLSEASSDYRQALIKPCPIGATAASAGSQLQRIRNMCNHITRYCGRECRNEQRCSLAYGTCTLVSRTRRMRSHSASCF